MFIFTVPGALSTMELTVEVEPSTTTGKAHRIEYSGDDNIAWEADELDDEDKGFHFRVSKLLERGRWEGRFLVYFPHTVVGAELLRRVGSCLTVRAEEPFCPSAVVNPAMLESVRKLPSTYWQHLSVSRTELERFKKMFPDEILLDDPVVTLADTERLCEFTACVDALRERIADFRTLLESTTEVPEWELLQRLNDVSGARGQVADAQRFASAITLNIERTELQANVTLAANSAFNDARTGTSILQGLPTHDALMQEVLLARSAWNSGATVSTEAPRHMLSGELTLLSRRFPLCRILSADQQGNLLVKINGVTFTYDGQNITHEGDLVGLMANRVAHETGTAKTSSRLQRLMQK